MRKTNNKSIPTCIYEENTYLTMKTNKQVIRLTESDLHRIVKESVSKILKEDYVGNYDELIKDEMHRLYELEAKLPRYLQPEIHSMVVTMEGMLQEIQRNRDFDRY